MEKKRNIEKLMVGAAFTIFVLIACYKLTNAPLWFDETVEFWNSKIMFGKLPYRTGINDSTNMYQRILSTFQPPLYNFIMYFWLKLGTSEWWFRFFGVVMGTIGSIGIFKTVKKISNTYTAAGAVFFSSCVLRLVYYWQECAEYCLLLGLLCWTIYAFICLLEKQSMKNIIIFTILCILPVYSQYGAVFPVAALLILAYVFIALKKDKKNIITITVSYLAAFVFTALPLVYLFLIKQLSLQRGRHIPSMQFSVEGNIFSDMFRSFRETISWNLCSYYGEAAATVLSWIFIICFVIFIFRSKNIYVRILAIVNVITWLLYYVVVKLGMYAYGTFGSRYDLFFIPLWIISLFCFGYEIYEFFKNTLDEKLHNSSKIFAGICAVAIACFMISSWTMKLQYNWQKEDMRSAVNSWLEADAQNSQTIVYYNGCSGFAYYLREQEDFSPEMEKNVVYMPWMYNKTVEDYTNYINSLYTDGWPQEIYLIGTHTYKDLDELLSAFTDKGYTREDINTTRCLLTRFSYAEAE